MLPHLQRKICFIITHHFWNDSFGDNRFFLAQNSAISAGTVSGLKLNLKVLGIGNGLTVSL